MSRDSNTGKKVAIGAAVAGVTGYLAGILTAPKSGKKTREQIADQASQTKSDIEMEVVTLNMELKDLVDKSKTATLTLGNKAKEEFNEALVRAKDAQNKTTEVLKAAKAGKADDPQLDKALKQAKQAKKNLAKYFKS